MLRATVEELEIKIRWRDVDNYGHVNNAVYLTYLEECRDRWVRQTLGPAVDFVIVRIAIDFRRELSLEDVAVVVTCRGTGQGTSSIRTAETIRAKAGWVAAEAESVVVAHDPAARKARPITPAERSVLEEAIRADGGELSAGGSAGRT
jgi:acyl-CoA thioester hydrolase